MLNPFFKNNGPFKISELLKTINIEDNKIQTDTEISDIKDLNSSDRNQITFYHSKKVLAREPFHARTQFDE